jgi:predicted XRE-type DNA-binding protein
VTDRQQDAEAAVGLVGKTQEVCAGRLRPEQSHLPDGNARTADAAKSFGVCRGAEAAGRRELMTDKENSGPVRGSGDFLRDMGYDDPDEMRVKFTLANTIAMAIEQRHLKQADVAKLTGLAQPDISRIVNGIVKDYSLIRLMRVLTALGKDVSIGITDTSGGRGVITAETSVRERAATGR